MPDLVQGEFAFANDFRVAIRVAKAAQVANVTEEAILGLVAEGKVESILVNTNPKSERKHRRILANSLWQWTGRPWRFEPPMKNTFRPDEFADLFDISTRHARRLAAAKTAAAPARRYGERGICFLREGIPAFVAARKTDE